MNPQWWYRFLGETELADDKNYSIISEKGTGNYSLKIKKASRNMSGTYTCKAINEMGEASSSGILNIIGKLLFTCQLELWLVHIQIHIYICNTIFQLFYKLLHTNAFKFLFKNEYIFLWVWLKKLKSIIVVDSIVLKF